MNNTHAWSRSFTCGGVIYAVLMGFVVLGTSEPANFAFRAGYVAAAVGIPVIITGFWASGSEKEWSWIRHALRVVIITVLFAAILVGPQLSSERHASPRQSNPYSPESSDQSL